MAKNETILDEIVRIRRARIENLGAAEGETIPQERSQNPHPFGTDPFLICEIKRRSPSKGNINNKLDPLQQAEFYTSRGATHISILTEPEYFGGSLADLMAVRAKYPQAKILRKDFILTREDIEVTHRVGADAFLLMASVLDAPTIKHLYELGVSKGMTPLVELHSPEEVDLVRPFKPKLVGINCRDLKHFTIDPLGPLKLKPQIDWDCQIVYESGIHSVKDARFALGCGFDGLLVGESVVKNKELVAGLVGEFTTRESHRPTYKFWRDLYKNYDPSRPLVKICGITRVEDAEKAVSLGADCLGFILAKSPRQIDPERLEDFKHIAVPKVGVVIVNKEGEDREDQRDYLDSLKSLLDRGLLDGVQFHGGESPELVNQFAGYKALTVSSRDDVEKAAAYQPRPVLIDAFHRDRSGKKSSVLDPELIGEARKRGNLWLAGGITADNVAELVSAHSPELIDLASGVEAAPGVKDHEKLTLLYAEVENSSQSPRSTGSQMKEQ